MSYQLNITVAATGAPEKRALGGYLYVRINSVTLNAAVEVSFDGETWQPANQNDSFGPLSPEAKNIYFRSSNGLASMVVFTHGKTPVAGQDKSVNDDPTYLLCCGGAAGSPAIIKAQDGGGASWTVTTGVGVANLANLLKIVGVNAGHKRKQITFQNSTLGNGSDVMVFDKNGFPFMRLKANDTPYTWLGNDTFYVGGLGGGTASGSFIFNEIYYAN